MSGSNIDTTRNAQGDTVIADTPRMWAQFVQLTDISIQNELSGSTHWGGYKDANDSWVAWAKRLPKYQQNPQRYIDYVIRRRREAGLPELVGYP